ncbi:hypothetical protein [Corynebacterium marinum]|jgi:heme A synthase|uniref:Secreted protein n=2 Tax=Corynebacterium marinum TaxID=349751 RepID=A0A0B6TUQ2_9CORY|nr:hypothetical protein [Corynebacterium marinum]AJK68456.1 hypothetical protein B840_04185 [Corynebacterium marinum DSM 44953]NLF89909.1 hypothetical protein [Corynebacterium marinum]GGO15155.1 hypothetical protein GCM10010980_10310 [Corynebacterium marinum]
MKTAYRSLAGLICGLVMLQAASEAWFASGVGKYIAEGGTIDMSDTSGPPPFTEVWGLIVHTISGLYVIPVVAAILLIVGYLTHDRRALALAAVVVILVGVQVTLGLTASSFTFLAFLHGFNALLIFGVALTAALTLGRQHVEPAPAPAAAPSRRSVGSGV